MKTERRVIIKEYPSTSDGKLDSLIITMEKMMDHMIVSERQEEN